MRANGLYLDGTVNGAPSDKPWLEVDRYIVDRLHLDDEVLHAALDNNRRHGLPAVDVSPAQGRLLEIFARMVDAHRILEVGTLGGYSTIWMARALPEDGHLITLELNAEFAKVAAENLDRAGLGDRVEVRAGNAHELMPMIVKTATEPFDMVFIDADKAGNPRYFELALQATRPGSVIIVDNTVRRGALVDQASDDASTRGARLLHETIARESRVIATTIQTVGSKGWDGFTIALVG